jgi:hypothetical protein
MSGSTLYFIYSSAADPQNAERVAAMLGSYRWKDFSASAP